MMAPWLVFLSSVAFWTAIYIWASGKGDAAHRSRVVSTVHSLVALVTGDRFLQLSRLFDLFSLAGTRCVLFDDGANEDPMKSTFGDSAERDLALMITSGSNYAFPPLSQLCLSIF